MKFTRTRQPEPCADCKRMCLTVGGTDLCQKCYEAAGLENEHDDGLHRNDPDPDCRRCAADRRGSPRPNPPQEDHPMSEPTITVVDNNDGTWNVRIDDDHVAVLTIAPMGAGAVSVDVRPTKPSKVDAVAFGASADYDAKNKRSFTLGKPDDSINPACEPFVCVAIYPKARKRARRAK